MTEQTPKLQPVVHHCAAHQGKQMAVLSGGEVVCSCWDKGADFVIGDLTRQSLLEIWDGPGHRALNERLARGDLPTRWCECCSFRRKGPAPGVRAPGPRKLLVEYNANCPLTCPGCERDLIEGNRRALRMTPAIVDRVVDEVRTLPGLEKIGFYNHGEPFLYRGATDFIARLKAARPRVTLFTTTNGLPLRSEARCRAVVESEIDEVMFSIDGASPQSYAQYRIGGDFNVALGAMETLIRLRHQLHRTRPKIIWRYLLFKWNDSDAELDRAIQLSERMGVDQLVFASTTYPAYAVSPRFRHGTHGTRLASYAANVF